MKKVISLLLLLSFLVTAVACAKPQETDAIDFGGTTPGATLLPGQTPDPNATLDPNATFDPNATPDPNATVDPNATPDPSATLLPGQTPGASTSPGASASPMPSSGPAPKSYSEAKKINSDVVGWIKVPGTNIDYPILYEKSGKFFYNNHDIYKKSTGNPGAGSIYSYYGDVTRNIIITGHNMRQAGTMFHELHKLQNSKSSLTTKSNRTFTITLPGFKAWNEDAQSKWEVFALYETKDSEPSSTIKYNTKHLSSKDGSNRQEIEDWIAKQKSRSEIDLGVSVSPDDILMTLVTCGDNYDYSEAQSRLYFFLKAVG